MAEILQPPPIRTSIVQSRYIDRGGQDHEIFGDVTAEWQRWFTRLRVILTAAGFGQMQQKIIISSIDGLVNPTHSSGPSPIANLGFFIPFTMSEQKEIKRILVPVITLAAGGNIDVGIYNSSKERLVSSGSVRVMSEMTQAINITNTVLDPGRYYMAVALDNSAVAISTITIGVGINRELGIFEKTSSFPLPATGTFNEHATRNYIPRFSLDSGGGQITPTFIGTAGSGAASGNVSITPPATVKDDILICAVISADNVASTFPAGWTIYKEGNNGAVLRSTVAWKRATGAEGAFTVTHAAGSFIRASVVVYRGCVATGSPINASSIRHNVASATCTATAITPTVPNCLILFTSHSLSGENTDQAATDPGAMKERFENNPSGILGVSGADGFNLAGASTGNATTTLAAVVDNTGILTSLTPLVK